MFGRQHYRSKYTLDEHNSDNKKILDILNNSILGFNSEINYIITTIIFKMCHPMPTLRFQSVDEILPMVNNLLNIINTKLLPVSGKLYKKENIVIPDKKIIENISSKTNKVSPFKKLIS